MVSFNFQDAAYIGLTPGRSGFVNSSFLGLIDPVQAEVNPVAVVGGGGSFVGSIGRHANRQVNHHARRINQPAPVVYSIDDIDNESDDEVSLMLIYSHLLY